MPPLQPGSQLSFLVLLCDALGLPEDTLCMALLILHRYQRWNETQNDEHIDLDQHLVSLASVSLASKATEHPRRMREILVPAYRIVHPEKPPLTFPSDLYDALRFSAVTSELIILRILKFELRMTLPQAYLSRLILRCLPPESQPSDTELTSTTLYRWAQAKIVQSMMSSRLALLYTPRTIAAACLYDTLRELNFHIASFEEWCSEIGKVDDSDVDEAIEDLRSLIKDGIGKDII